MLQRSSAATLELEARRPEAGAATKAAAEALRQWKAVEQEWRDELAQCEKALALLEAQCPHTEEHELLCTSCLQQSSHDDDPTPADHDHTFICSGCRRRTKRPATQR